LDLAKFKKILVLVPHLDDAELGCGGTIARFVEAGMDVYYIAFSFPSGAPKDILEREGEKSRKILGIPQENFYIHDYQVRKLPFHLQDILEDLIKWKKRVDPDLILMPSLNDLHQDHQTVAEEGLRAFKTCTILGWEQPWNQLSYSTCAFIELKKEDVEKKILAASCYQSQNNRRFFEPEFLFSFARTRGVQINVEFAEAFEVVRWSIYLPNGGQL